MEVHGSEMDSVPVPVSDLAQPKPRQTAMQEPLPKEVSRAKAISAGFNSATGLKSLNLVNK